MRIEAMKQYVFEVLATQLPEHLYYHNFQHTRHVLTDARLLCEVEKAGEEDCLVISIAALLHDTGFTHTTIEHEKVSCDFARSILPQYDCEVKVIDTVCELIMATKTPQRPESKAAEILCDADLFYLGTDKFKEYGDNLYRELQALHLIDSYEAWNIKQVQFLSGHTYFTKSARQMLDSRKLENLNKVKAAISL